MVEAPTQIAVIIPAYNSAHFLPESIGSVLRQTEPVSEILVVDDGSTDNTREVVGAYGAPVRYLRRPNGGAAAARNTGVEQTSAPWIAFLDADDRWAPRKIALQMEALRADPGAVLCYTGRLAFGANTAATASGLTPPERLWPMLRYQNPITLSSVLMRRDVFQQAGGFDERLPPCEDWDLWFRLGPELRMVAVDQPVTLYRVTPASLSMDVDRMLSATKRVLASSLLKDLRGWDRWSWRRRAWSAELARSAITAYETGDPRFLSLLIRSLAEWPSPKFLPRRWKALPLYLYRYARGTKGGAATVTER